MNCASCHGFKLTQRGRIRGSHATELGTPLVKGGLAKAATAAQSFDEHACFGLLEVADFVPSSWYGWEGVGHQG